MGLQQSRQAPPKLEQQQRRPVEPEPTFDGLVPRSLTARQACNARRVRRLIRAQRLAPCWRELEAEGEGEECPVCMEVYERLNSTACCHQDICTECFICVVAPGGVSSRCPYCQAHALQVYLQPQPCYPADAEATAEAVAAAAEGSTGAAAAASDPAPVEPGPPSRPPSSMAGSSSSAGGSSTTRAASTASSGLSMGSLDLDGESVPFTAFLAPAPAAAAREAVRQHQEAMRLGCAPDRAGSGCGSLVPVSISLGCDLRLLAEAAANANRAEGPAIVAMVRRAGEPSSSGSGVHGSSGSEPGSSGGSGGGGEPSSHAGAAAAAASSEQPGGEPQSQTVTAEPAAPHEELSMPAEGGPAVLQLPDGSEQLVLLRSAQQEAAEEAAAQAAALRRQQEQEAADVAALPSYQPPATREDERVRHAIAQADAALLQHQPASTSRGPSGGDWLEQLRQADAALQAAVARNDAQRFDAGGSSGTDQGASSDN
ncbi:ring u-box domain-containing [Chlorella sorokiniana]|uniref:Ring u-box domain-containing n=1 Tax=Chlorella sorokiniana TaxID=3076 RepID=A0A2P6TDX9_CHLSO|nr:ring u-box domain-containing [Chlorella sorokiniana]|eukprot:PRW20850.1 ring u-box domain-containing [Chlorella sorokiniana]